MGWVREVMGWVREVMGWTREVMGWDRGGYGLGSEVMGCAASKSVCLGAASK